jgi:hypothetical protein
VCTLQRHACDRPQLIARIFDDLRQYRAQHFRALREDQTELGQQAPDPVDAGGSLFLVAFSPSVQRPLLCCSTLLTGTKRMLGREAASQFAAASAASFLPVLPLSR